MNNTDYAYHFRPSDNEVNQNSKLTTTIQFHSIITPHTTIMPGTQNPVATAVTMILTKNLKESNKAKDESPNENSLAVKANNYLFYDEIITLSETYFNVSMSDNDMSPLW